VSFFKEVGALFFPSGVKFFGVGTDIGGDIVPWCFCSDDPKLFRTNFVIVHGGKNIIVCGLGQVCRSRREVTKRPNFKYKRTKLAHYAAW
jgi:hypothetical protein